MQKIKLWNKPFCNELHFFLFAVILFVLSLRFTFFFIVLILYLGFILKKTKYAIPIVLLLLLVFLSFYLHFLYLKELPYGVYEDTYTVVDVNHTTVVLKGSTKLIVFNTTFDLKPGDVIHAKLKVYPLDQASYAGDFDAKAYYAAEGITNRASIIECETLQENWSIARMKYNAMTFYQARLGKRSMAYVQTLFFGVSALDKKVKNAFSLLYLSHILAISGMHIALFYRIMLWFFQRVFHIKGEQIALGILGIYVIWIGCPSSCLRAFLFLLLSTINKKSTLPYTQLDIYSITFIGMLLVSPYKIFQTGFILSFIVSFVMLFMKDFISTNARFKKSICTSLLCIASILPFVINQSNEVSWIGIGVSLVLGMGIGKGLLLFTMLLLICPLKCFEVFFEGFDEVLIFISNLLHPIRVPHISIGWMVVYYILFIFILICLAKNKRKYFVVFPLFYFCALLSIRVTNIYYKVTFIDVGQGDSILIELPHNKGTILVDSYNDNVSYLKSIGLYKIDCVVLTHFDADHMNSIEEVVDTFQVNQIKYSKYEDVTKIQNINVEKEGVKGGEQFQVGGVSFFVLGPIYPYKDGNSNSVVLCFELEGYRFLLTGDMTQKEEKDVLSSYKEKLQCDVLKVGHHGSNTSSSLEFIEACKPHYSIISVGSNNIYGLPHTEVLERLKNTNVYMTKDCGNIQFKIYISLSISAYRMKI